MKLNEMFNFCKCMDFNWCEIIFREIFLLRDVDKFRLIRYLNVFKCWMFMLWKFRLSDFVFLGMFMIELYLKIKEW